MTTLIEQLFGLKFATSVVVDDTSARERRMAEVIALLADIAAPSEASLHDDHGFDDHDADTAAAA